MIGAVRRWIERHVLHVSLALLAYVPLLLTAPDKVPGDTKLYLYLDPWRLMSDAAFSWDSRQFGGWVPHQNVGYLWPSGPWFGFFDLIGAPDWVAHRLWMATLLFVAGSGVVHLGRRLQLSPTTIVVAAFTYQFTPFVLPYISRTSALLLPWALLGWIVAVTIRFTHERRLGQLAVFALLIFSSGGLNATALLVIAPAPVAVIVDALWRRRVSIRSALVTTGILGATTIAMSAWWLAGLVIQGRHGSAVLSYTEALPSTAATSTAPEVLRGLGYWLFYDRNAVVRLTSAADPYQSNPVVFVAGVVIVVSGLLGLRSLRSDVRRPLALMFVAGVVLAVGAHPYSSPTPAWRLLVDNPQSALSLALRSSTRAAPLIVVALAFGFGHLVDRTRLRALRSSRPRLAVLAVPLALAIVMINLPALLSGRMVDPVMERPEQLPAAWTDAASLLDQRFDEGHTGAVLMLPGIESAAFRWGYPVDPILPGLTKKPMLNRDWVPQGSAPHMDLLYALDDSFQNGTADARSIAPIARLLGVDTVMVVNTYQYERFGLDPPARAAEIIDSAPGLVRVAAFGDPTTNVAPFDDASTSTPLPEIVVYEVRDAPSGFRASDSPLVVSGDGTSLVELAASELVDGRSIVLHSAALDRDQLRAASTATTEVIVTDGNRKRAHHWRGSQNVWGATETAADASDDEFDNRLPVFPTSDGRTDTQSVVDTSGDIRVSATGYGALLAYYPEYRPAMAVDDDPSTAWLVGWGLEPVGQILEIHRDSRPITTLRLVPATHPNGVRTITRASVSLDGGAWSDIDLSDPDGTVALSRPAASIRLRVDAVADDGRERNTGSRPSGWAEVLPLGEGSAEYITTPTDAVDVVDARTPVSYHFARLRADSTDSERSDPERSLRRMFRIAHDDGFVVSATARSTGDRLLEASGDCRTDLLQIDSTPIPLRITAVNEADVVLEACAPLTLERGSRVLSTSSDSSIIIDRLTLRSSRAVPSPPATVFEVSTSRTTRDARIPECPSERCWVESTDGWNTGWSATIAGDPTDPPIASASGRGTWIVTAGPSADFHSEWTPQRVMWIGLAVSAVGMIAALVALVTGRLRRHRIGREPNDAPDDSPNSSTRLLGPAVVSGLVIALFVHPIAGVVAAVVTVVEHRLPPIIDRILVGLVALGYVYILVQQSRYGTPTGFGWPGTYAKAHGVVLFSAVAYGLRLTRDRPSTSGTISHS